MGAGKFFKACHSIFSPESPARRSTYLKSNDLREFYNGKSTEYLFLLKYCIHLWLENGKTIDRILEILPYLKNFIKCLKENKSFPDNDERFSSINHMLSLPILPTILQFSKCVIDDKEPFSQLF